MLYIVLPVHNRVKVTARFIAALRAQTFVDYTLVLVDDGCTDGTIELVREHIAASRLVVLRGDGNLWWAGSLQLAYEHLGTCHLNADDAVMLINDDVAFEPNFLSTGMALLKARPDACYQAVSVDRDTGIIARGVVVDTRRLLFRGTQANEAPNCLSTRGLLMRAVTFAESGGFRPRWLPHYYSDYEFTMRLRRGGVELLYADEFALSSDATTTGDDTYSGKGLRQFLSRSFSNRAKFNPKHSSAFAILVCPAWAVPGHLLRIWFRFGRALLQALRSSDERHAVHR